MTLLESQCFAILSAAARSEFGLIIRAQLSPIDDSLASPSARAKQVLYRFRREFGTDFAQLQFRLSPTDPANELWIINQRGAQALPSEAEVETASEITMESL